MTTIHWPADKWTRAKDLLALGHSIAVVAHRIGDKAQNLRSKIRWENMTPAQKEARRERINICRKSRAEIPSERRPQPEQRYERAPAYVLEERAQRQAAVRSPIAELLNEPPPGYSALDRKRQEVPETPYIDRRMAQLLRKPTLPGMSA